MKIILIKEELFQDFCIFLKTVCKKFNNFEISYIVEKWGIILKDKNIENIKKKYEELKREINNNIDNNLIRIKDIVNNSDNSKNFFVQIFDMEPDYSWVARMTYANILAKEKVNRLSELILKNKFHKQIQSIKELQIVKKNIDTHLGDLSSISTLNKMVFSFFIKNVEKIKDKDFKTEIELQNENRKNFLEVLKNLIDENIETIQRFIDENNSKNTLETDKLLKIEDVIKKTNTINIEYKRDIKQYLDEFGFNTFEILIIKKNKHYIGNIVIIALGVLEFCAGAALLAYSANPYVFKLARFLIREGIKDIVKGVKACIEGEEINLKYYAIETGINIACFAIELVIGKVPENLNASFKDKLLNVVKGECISLAKQYGNRYIANKLVKKLIKKMSGKIKEHLISPLMEMIQFNGENIDKYIQHDIINDTDLYKNAILKQTEIALDQIDHLIDFIGPIIEIIKILSSKGGEKVNKMKNFLEYMSNFDYHGIYQFSKNLYDAIKNKEIDINFDNSLSSIIKASNTSLKEEEIDNICKELIECGVINKNGKFNTELVKINGFKQILDIKIDDKYLQYEYNRDKKCSEELENNLNFIALKVSENIFNNKKKEIKDEIYSQLETFMESIIERILDLLEDKINEQFEKLWKKYKEKKAAENQEIENEEKKVKNQENADNEEDEEIQVTKKSNQNNNDNTEEEGIILPELNNEEINKNKSKTNNEEDNDNVIIPKKNKTSNDDNNINDDDIDISSKNKTKEEKKAKEEKEKKEKEEKEKEKKEKGIALREEKETSKVLSGLCKFSVQFGISVTFKEVVIPKFIDALSNWFKKILSEKLLPLLLSRFDEYFEKLGTHIIILQKKYNIKQYIDNLLEKIKKFFYIISNIQKFITPYLRKAMEKAKKEGVNTLQTINEFIDQLLSDIEKIMKPIKEFIDKVFEGSEQLEAYKLYKNVLVEGYNFIRTKGIEKYEKLKISAGEKYNEIKDKYLNKRKELCSLPDELEKKFEEKKNELIQKYEESKNNIINSTNEILEQLKGKDSSEAFREYFTSLKHYINQKLNDIKEESKNKIKNITSKIPNFIDNFTNLIDNILAIDFGPFKENKIDICHHITTFILEIQSGNIKIEHENENNEIITENLFELLVVYLNQQLNIEKQNVIEMVEYLSENGLKSFFIGKINVYVITSLNNKVEIIKSYYEPTLKMIKNYFGTFKGGISNFINKCNDKINQKIDYFDYIIRYINKIFQNQSLYDFYCMIEENILIHKDLNNTFLDGINTLKNALITNLSDELTNETNKLYEKIINSNKYKEIKEKSKKTINDMVHKTENKVFGYINNQLKIEEEKDPENENKNENKSEFEKFDKNIGKVIDNKICTKAAELEQKLIKYAKHLDNQSQEYLKLKFGNKIDKNKFDALFNSVNVLKEKKNKLFSSEKTKQYFNKVDNALLKVANSKHVEKTINFIDGINVGLANEIIGEIQSITALFEEERKEDFRDNIKKLIIEKINKCYEIFLEPKIKKLVINIGNNIVDKISKKLNTKK